MKHALGIILLVLLVGCSAKDPIIKYEYVEKRVPVLAVPAPPDVSPPVYETTTLTASDKNDIGKVAKAFVVENRQKDGYITVLEAIIDKYRNMAVASEIKLAPMKLPEPIPTRNELDDETP